MAGTQNVSSMINGNERRISGERQGFVNSSMDDKMLILFDKLTNISNEQTECPRTIMSIQHTMDKMAEKVSKVIEVTNTQSDLLKTLAYKSIDMEARSRRNNLVFWGFVENRDENCFGLIRDFLNDKLCLEADRMYLCRAHRLGRRNPNMRHQRRPIIVNFRDHCDIEDIMRQAYMLKGTSFSIDYDMPKEIQMARKQLWPKYKQAKSDHPRAKVKIVYPAKLIVDGRLVHDGLPEWNKYVHGDRLPVIQHVGFFRHPTSPYNNEFSVDPADRQSFRATQIEPMEAHHASPSRQDSMIAPPSVLQATTVEPNHTHEQSQVAEYSSQQNAHGFSMANILSEREETPDNTQAVESSPACTSTHTITLPQAHEEIRNNDSICEQGNISHTGSTVSVELNACTFSNSQLSNTQPSVSDVVTRNIQQTDFVRPDEPDTPSQHRQNRGVAHVSREIRRSVRRSQSSNPYGRSISTSRERVSPAAINSPQHSTDTVNI